MTDREGKGELKTTNTNKNNDDNEINAVKLFSLLQQTLANMDSSLQESMKKIQVLKAEYLKEIPYYKNWTRELLKAEKRDVEDNEPCNGRNPLFCEKPTLDTKSAQNNKCKLISEGWHLFDNPKCGPNRELWQAASNKLQKLHHLFESKKLVNFEYLFESKQEAKFQPPLNRGGIEPPLNRGGIEPPLNRGGIEPPLNRGGLEPSVLFKPQHPPLYPYNAMIIDLLFDIASKHHITIGFNLIFPQADQQALAFFFMWSIQQLPQNSAFWIVLAEAQQEVLTFVLGTILTHAPFHHRLAQIVKQLQPFTSNEFNLLEWIAIRLKQKKEEPEAEEHNVQNLKIKEKKNNDILLSGVFLNPPVKIKKEESKQKKINKSLQSFFTPGTLLGLTVLGCQFLPVVNSQTPNPETQLIQNTLNIKTLSPEDKAQFTLNIQSAYHAKVSVGSIPIDIYDSTILPQSIEILEAYQNSLKQVSVLRTSVQNITKTYLDSLAFVQIFGSKFTDIFTDLENQINLYLNALEDSLNYQIISSQLYNFQQIEKNKKFFQRLPENFETEKRKLQTDLTRIEQAGLILPKTFSLLDVWTSMYKNSIDSLTSTTRLANFIKIVSDYQINILKQNPYNSHVAVEEDKTVNKIFNDNVKNLAFLQFLPAVSEQIKILQQYQTKDNFIKNQGKMEFERNHPSWVQTDFVNGIRDNIAKRASITNERTKTKIINLVNEVKNEFTKFFENVYNDKNKETYLNQLSKHNEKYNELTILNSINTMLQDLIEKQKVLVSTSAVVNGLALYAGIFTAIMSLAGALIVYLKFKGTAPVLPFTIPTQYKEVKPTVPNNFQTLNKNAKNVQNFQGLRQSLALSNNSGSSSSLNFTKNKTGTKIEEVRSEPVKNQGKKKDNIQNTPAYFDQIIEENRRLADEQRRSANLLAYDSSSRMVSENQYQLLAGHKFFSKAKKLGRAVSQFPTHISHFSETAKRVLTSVSQPREVTKLHADSLADSHHSGE